MIAKLIAAFFLVMIVTVVLASLAVGSMGEDPVEGFPTILLVSFVIDVFIFLIGGAIFVLVS